MDPKETAYAFASDLRAELGEELIGATLFGSVVRGEHAPGLSDIDVLLLVDDIDARFVSRIAPIVRRYERDRLDPLPLERLEWERARDVFAIELLDMRDAHELLTGTDPTDGLVIDREPLRLQAERELRSKLIALRSGLLRFSDDGTSIGELLRRSVPSFVAYLRAALRLSDHDGAPRASREVVHTGCELIGADPAGYLAALDARSRKDWTVPLDDAVVASFNDAAEKTAAYVDRA